MPLLWFVCVGTWHLMKDVFQERAEGKTRGEKWPRRSSKSLEGEESLVIYPSERVQHWLPTPRVSRRVLLPGCFHSLSIQPRFWFWFLNMCGCHNWMYFFLKCRTQRQSPLLLVLIRVLDHWPSPEGSSWTKWHGGPWMKQTLVMSEPGSFYLLPCVPESH